MKAIIIYSILLVALLVWDHKGRGIGREHGKRGLRAVAGGSILAIVLADYFLIRRPENIFFVSAAACDLYAGAVLLSEGMDGELQERWGTVFPLLAYLLPAFVCTLALIWVREPYDLAVKLIVMPVLITISKVCEMTLLLRRSFHKVVGLFSNDKIWYNARAITASVYLIALGVVSVLACASAVYESWWIAWTAFVLALAGFAVFYMRNAFGRTVFLPRAKEKELLAIIRGSLRATELEGGVEDNKMRALYKKVLNYMEERKPYLDNQLDLDYFARKLFTNKVYLSRTINVFSGRNFRQFINYHRVEYSLALMRKDPYLRIEEVASMCGFNSTVSYNMAFRMFKGMTPREWLDKYRDGVRS